MGIILRWFFDEQLRLLCAMFSTILYSARFAAKTVASFTF
jgi:hypothetical protein